MNNSLNFKRKFTIPQFTKIVKAIFDEESIRYGRRLMTGNHYVITNSLLNNLIIKLSNLSGYDDLKQFNQSKKLNTMSIIERIYKLILLFFKNIRNNNNNINYIGVYNCFGIIAFINLIDNRLGTTELYLYIEKINRFNKGKTILVVFLYNLIEYINKFPQNNNKEKYSTFIKNYQKMLFRIDQKFFSQEQFSNKLENDSIFKKIVNNNTKEAQNKANANAKAEKIKANANAKAVQNKANANAKAVKNKCTEEWDIYNKYKKDHPLLFRLGKRTIKRPTCGKEHRLSKQTITLNLNQMNKYKPNTRPRSNTGSTGYSNNLNNNKLRQPIQSQ